MATPTLFLRTLRACFIVLTMVLVIRAAFIEPFQIATGSMAPRLLGVHRKCDCPKCGFPVIVGAPTSESHPDHYAVRCPNCGQDNLGLENQPDLPGQRIWVDKTAFELRSPRRWEVVVFRGPDEKATPYVKRVVGLPGESVQIKDGHLYVNGALCQKPYAVCMETSFLVYDGRHRVANRWRLEGPVKENPSGLEFRCLAGPPATATFRLPPIFRAGPITDYFVYNGARVERIESVFDFRISCDATIMAESMNGDLDFYLDEEIYGFDTYGPHPGMPSLRDRFDEAISPRRKLTPGKQHRIDILNFQRGCDLQDFEPGCGQDMIRAIDGDSAVVIGNPEPKETKPVSRLMEIGVRNADVRLDNIRIYRDTHYQSVGRHAISSPYRLGPDEYFVLGDNSAASDDSRFWPSPGVKHSSLIGKPMFDR